MYSWLPSKIAIAAAAAHRLGVTASMRLGPQANDGEIIDAERLLGVSLSHSHAEFLKMHNGALFGVILPGPGEEIPAGVKIFSIAEMLMNTREYSRIFADHDEEGSPPFWRCLIIIARSGGGLGDLCLSGPEQPTANDEYAILDGFNETPHLWREMIIAKSFAEWLERMLDSLITDGNLPEYWMPTSIADDFRDV